MRYLITLIAIPFLWSCDKSEDSFYERKSHILGMWQCVSTEELITDGEFVSKDTSNFNLNFKEDEAVIFTYNSLPGYEDNYIWHYQLDPEKVIIRYSQSGLIRLNNYFKVITNTANFQYWEEVRYYETPTSDDNKKIITWTLNRI